MNNLARILWVSLICSSKVVLSNDTNPLSEADFLIDIPTVEAATRYSTPLSHTPASVTVITRDMIDALPSTNFIDALKLAPGFQVFFANGSIQAVTLNGQNDRFPTRLEIRIDGRSVYTPINSSLSWESLGLTVNDIARIEVVRGSNIAVYGANAAQGAINIVTRDPFTDSGTEISYTAGSWSTHNTSVRHSFNTTASAYTLRANYRENQGFDHIDDQSYADSATFQGVYTPTLDNEFQWNIGYSDGNFGFGDGDRVDEFADENINTQWLSLNWKHLQGAHSIKMKTSVNLGVYDRSRLTPLTEELGISPAQLATFFPGESNQLIETEEGRREYKQYDLELEDHITLNHGSSLLWGIGIRHQRLTAPSEFNKNSDSSETVYFAFSNIDWRFNNYWAAHFGFLAEEHSHQNRRISPRISLNYHLSEAQHFRLSGSVGYRQPSLYERDRVIQRSLSTGDIIDLIFISDSKLGPEKFKTFELAYIGYWFNKRLSIDYRLFRENLDDTIKYIKRPYSDINGKFRQLENTSNNRTSGYETQIQWRPTIDWLISAQYYNTRMVQNTRSSEHIASLLISKKLSHHWRISGAFYHQSKINWLRGANVPSWHRYDLKLSKEWQLNSTNLALALVVQNVTNENYIEYQAGNLFEQMTYLNLKVSF